MKSPTQYTHHDFAVLDKIAADAIAIQQSSTRRRKVGLELRGLAAINDEFAGLTLEEFVGCIDFDDALNVVADYIDGSGELMSIVLAKVVPIINWTVCRRYLSAGLRRQEATQIAVATSWQVIAEYSLANPKNLTRMLFWKLDNVLRVETSRQARNDTREVVTASVGDLASEHDELPLSLCREMWVKRIESMGIPGHVATLVVTSRMFGIPPSTLAEVIGSTPEAVRMARSRGERKIRSSLCAV